VFTHIVLFELLEKRYDRFILCSLLWKLDVLCPELAQRAKLRCVRDVEEVDTLLYDLSAINPSMEAHK